MQTVELVDGEARRQAVDPRLSCIVRAPAGSGKTELLIQRYLALLGRVQRPDEILAITFTRKAAAEMVQRVLGALRVGSEPLDEGAAEHARTTYRLARAALQRDRELGWRLLEHPDQLQIKTIDSFNAALVRGMPWLTRMGGLPQVNEDPRKIYRKAVRGVVHLHHRQPEMNAAIKNLLLHLDNRVDLLQEMMVQLLARRDQWLRHLLTDDARQRSELEAALSGIICTQLHHLLDTIDARTQQELMELGAFAADNCAKEGRALMVLCQFNESGQQFPRACPDDLELWRGLADLLLTAEGKWRKRCDRNCGFPPGKAEPFAGMKQRMQVLLERLSTGTADSALWHRVRQLPDPNYAEQQWRVLQALLTVLPRTVAQLWLEFGADGEVDFVEIALRARQALVDSGNPTEQLLALDQQLNHILIDEFQDTSWLQYDLLRTLTSGWQKGDGRSLFIVGDPMQSIYRFREAEVGLFLRAANSGIGMMGLKPLQLRANFRSRQGIVDWVNNSFANIFPLHEDSALGAVTYSRAQAVIPDNPASVAGDAVELFTRYEQDSRAEAEQVCRLIQRLQYGHPQQTIAILVRSRSHLVDILKKLRLEGVCYLAQDLDSLSLRPAVTDIVALTRALLHPGDHLSWLTVLRAPWCGLLLEDMIHFRVQPEGTVLQKMTDPACLEQLSVDGARRVRVVAAILTAALKRRGSCPLRQLIEETWRQLRGPQCYADGAGNDVEQLLTLVEKLDCGGDLLSFEQLDEEVEHLFSVADITGFATSGGGVVQVMTIHRAKGLEFDHVILPGLGRRPRNEEKRLLRWQEHTEHGLLLAPIARRGGQEGDPIYDMLGQVDKTMAEHEIARLLYVAATRAKSNLYLFAHAELDKKQEPYPVTGSLLETLWSAVKQHFSAAAAVDNTDNGFDSCADNVFVPFCRLTDECFMVDEAAQVQSESGDNGTLEGMPTLGERIPALVGTVTHEWLAYLAEHRHGRWSAADIEGLRDSILARLVALGVDKEHIPALGNSIIQMLQTTAASERGRWILAPHARARCEYSLSGVVCSDAAQDEGSLHNLVIDRTFVADGVRWIIDYKTSVVRPQQSLSDFYARQEQLYRPQLEGYASFMAQLDQKHPCHCALYFPAFDGWFELED